MTTPIEPNTKPGKRGRKAREIEVIFERVVPSPEAEERLLKAFEMILKDIPLDLGGIDSTTLPKSGEQQRLF